MNQLVKLLRNLLLLFAVAFLASIVIYFTNADMKLSAKLAKLLEPWYDKMERDRRM